MVAGGLGLAPLRTAIDALADGGPTRLTVVMGAREPDQVLFPDDLRRWRSLGVDVHVTVDTADRAWDGSVGTATELVARLGERHDVVFVCGPELMMTSAARAAVDPGRRSAAGVGVARTQHALRDRALWPLPARPAAAVS